MSPSLHDSTDLVDSALAARRIPSRCQFDPVVSVCRLPFEMRRGRFASMYRLESILETVTLSKRQLYHIFLSLLLVVAPPSSRGCTCIRR